MWGVVIRTWSAVWVLFPRVSVTSPGHHLSAHKLCLSVCSTCFAWCQPPSLQQAFPYQDDTLKKLRTCDFSLSTCSLMWQCSAECRLDTCLLRKEVCRQVEGEEGCHCLLCPAPSALGSRARWEALESLGQMQGRMTVKAWGRWGQRPVCHTDRRAFPPSAVPRKAAYRTAWHTSGQVASCEPA